MPSITREYRGRRPRNIRTQGNWNSSGYMDREDLGGSQGAATDAICDRFPIRGETRLLAAANQKLLLATDRGNHVDAAPLPRGLEHDQAAVGREVGVEVVGVVLGETDRLAAL